jgi:hypothetical protein
MNGALVWHFGNQSLFVISTCSFPVNNLFPFLLATAKSLGDVWMNRQSGVKFPLSYNCTNSIGASNWLFKLAMPCKPPDGQIFILQTWSASPFQDINTSAPILLELWMFISWIRKADRMGNWSRPIDHNWQRITYSSRQCLFRKL